ELDVVLDHSIGFVRLAQEPTGAVFNFVDCVGDLVPDNRCKVVEAQRAAALLDRGVKGNHCVAPPVLAPREAYVTYHADQPAPRNQCIETLLPDFVELC